ncbi:hypothetical protein [Sphingomonas sp. R1]|uniref:hypothetical protein n=1 Tax=Sphingomonas sp. R1 TaxID=399176 RepID=UPI002224168E|nr:hypothetical protein [Sphingomonas sp. R1]UYY77471.1 hypothetical protein OIM94_00210 [Sphingomonas sp. R1]
MANQTVTTTEISVHSRGSLELTFRFYRKTGPTTREQIDLSTRTLFFEVDGVPIREALVAHSTDTKAKVIILESDQVETLRKTATECLIRDETEIATRRPKVIWRSTIKRFGFLGAPDAQVDE